MLNILLSVPAISLFIFSLWRIITIIGIVIAATSKGQRLLKLQLGINIIAKISVTGKVREAAIEASEIYRHTKTTIVHIAKLSNEQIV